jgi:hypothetical protein
LPPLVTEEEEEQQQPRLQRQQGAHVKQYSPFKRVRMEYGGRVVHPGAQLTPPLTSLSSADAAAEMIQLPPLDLSNVERPSKKYRRTHSLALSDVSLVDQLATEDFVNPFEEEDDPLFFFNQTPSSPPKAQYQEPNNNHLGTVPLDTLHHASSAESSSSSAQSSVSFSIPRPGFYRNNSSFTTSNGDLAGLRALMQSSSSNNGEQHSVVRGHSDSTASKWERRDSVDSTTSSRSISSINDNRTREELDLTDPLHYFFCQTRGRGDDIAAAQ